MAALDKKTIFRIFHSQRGTVSNIEFTMRLDEADTDGHKKTVLEYERELQRFMREEFVLFTLL